jgi:hypothetical protein
MLDRLERAVERIVEGGIAGAFRLRVQPAEIGRHLERAMLDGRRSSVGGPVVPNRYLVRLHPEDAASFGGWEEALCRELETWLAELSFERGFATIGPLRVDIAPDEAVRRRAVRADARFCDEPSPAPTNREGTPRLRLLAADPAIATLWLVADAVTVGRAGDNDLVLRDPEVSRHHARFESTDSGWRVVDLGSTNGTWVNGARRERHAIAAGDVVAFGGVRFLVAPE